MAHNIICTIGLTPIGTKHKQDKKACGHQNGLGEMNSLQILYRSDEFVVVHKPYDLKINSNDPGEVTVETILLDRGIKCKVENGKQLAHSFYFVHRLDHATSGVLCIGLTKQAARLATRAFEKRNVRKCYMALVRGEVSLEGIVSSHTNVQLVNNGVAHLDVYASLVRDRGTDFPYIFTTHSDSSTEQHEEKVLSASTSVYILQTGCYDGEDATKVLLVPHTGRSHQLRVHCKYIGHTIVGDYTYSNRSDTRPYRMMLHAYYLHIPLTDDITVTSEDPFENDLKWVVGESFVQIEDLLEKLV